MGILKDKILGFTTLDFKDIPVPQWDNVIIRIRALTGKERDDWELRFLVNKKKGEGLRQDRKALENSRARLVALCAIDPETGVRIFTTEEEIEALGKTSAAALDLLYGPAAELAGITKKDIEELEKN